MKINLVPIRQIDQEENKNQLLLLKLHYRFHYKGNVLGESCWFAGHSFNTGGTAYDRIL